MATRLLTLLPFLLLGCLPGSDKDDDGLTKKEEKELGTDPKSDDSDGDGILDGEEVDLGTDPLEEDSDGDGLDDGEELDLGTDPTLGDSDSDGLGDADELDNDSDPTNVFSWPGDGMWPDTRALAEADGVAGSEYAVGEAFPNFSAPDRYGTSVELYQFYGEVILIDFSAGWCGPCQSVAAEAQDFWEEYRDDGFVIIHAMIDDYNGGDADADFLADWADAYDLTFPVLGDDDAAEIDAVYNDLYYAGLNEGYIPYMILLNQNMEIETIYTGSGNEPAIESKVSDLLGL